MMIVLKIFNTIEVLFPFNIQAIPFIEEVDKYGVVEEPAYLGFVDEPYGENEEGKRQENNLRKTAQHSADNALFTCLAYNFEGRNNAETGGEDAKEETAQRVEEIVTDLSESHK